LVVDSFSQLVNDGGEQNFGKREDGDFGDFGDFGISFDEGDNGCCKCKQLLL
jgi:hypothetical protein